ncbi:MAG TPA: dolichol-phosphate mannosyltransferase, partial [Acetobacteraceae bacterium]|nr:dolichol-phosphate mannosyltransferase [Acetobacteraceae bacterium]
INHRPRTRGRSHYGVISRGLVGIVDLLGVFWLLRRASRPVIEIEGSK